MTATITVYAAIERLRQAGLGDCLSAKDRASLKAILKRLKQELTQRPCALCGAVFRAQNFYAKHCPQCRQGTPITQLDLSPIRHWVFDLEHGQTPWQDPETGRWLSTEAALAHAKERGPL